MAQDSILFIEDLVLSMMKSGKRSAGDYYTCIRNESYTDFILCDGIGSGIKAGIAARMCATRIVNLLSGGMSLIKTAERIVSYMHGIRDRDIPYSVFLIARVLNDGNFTIAGYEMPEPFVLYETGCGKISSKYSKFNNEVIFECAGSLEARESLLLCSDGITQSGMGNGLAMGWTTEGLLKWMDRKIQSGKKHDDTVKSAFDEALKLSGGAV